MKRFKKFVSICLTGSLLLSTVFSQGAMADSGGTPEETMYTVTLDANGGYFETGYVEDEVPEGVSEYESGISASGSNAVYGAGKASGSNAGGVAYSLPEESEARPKQLKIQVPKGTDIGLVIDDNSWVKNDHMNTFCMGWTTTKNDIMSNVYNEPMLGGIGVKKTLRVDRDITVYALWMEYIDFYENPDETEWGTDIHTLAVNETGEILNQNVEILKPQISEDELRESLQKLPESYRFGRSDYDKAFQAELSGISGKQGMVMCVIGERERPAYLFELSDDGKTVISEVPVLLSRYGDDSGRDGTNLAFSVDHSGKYLVVPMEKVVDVTVENVKGGFVMAQYVDYDENGKQITKVIPIGETVQIPTDTELELMAYPFTDFYMSGMDDAGWDAFYEMEAVRLDGYSFEYPGGEKEDVASDDYMVYKVSVDTRISGKFVIDDTVDDDTPVVKEHDFGIILGENSYKEPCKVDTEVIVYDGNRNNRIEVENLAISGGIQNDYELFELEGNRLKSIDQLSYGSYTLKFEFDYEGKHYSQDNRNPRLRGHITVGAITEFGGFLASASFNGKEYYVSESGFLGTVVYSSPNALYSDIVSQPRVVKETEGTKLVNYTFEDWYDLSGNKVNPDRKIGENGLEMAAKFVNDKGNTYHITVLPLEDDGDDNPGGGDHTGGGDDSGSGSSSSGGSSSGGGGSKRAVLNQAAPMTGQWQSENGIWKFLKTNGTYAQNEWGMINGKWYYFGNDTTMQTKWLFWNNEWYYLDPTEGSMKTGWIQDAETGFWFLLTDSGAMATGWQMIGGKWYYMNPVSDGTRGKMVTDQWIGDYYVNSAGEWVEGMTK